MEPKSLDIDSSENRSSSKGPVAKASHGGFDFLDRVLSSN